MNRTYFIFARLVVVASVLLACGCQPRQDAEPEAGSSSSASAAPALETSVPTGDRRQEAETLLEISLPEEAAVSTILDNPRAVGVLGRTDLPLDEARSFFSDQMSRADYRMARAWGVSPRDDESLRSATFTGGGETWAIILRAQQDHTVFDIQRQRQRPDASTE